MQMFREILFVLGSVFFKNRFIVEFLSELGSGDWNDFGNQIEYVKLLLSIVDGLYFLMLQGVFIIISSFLGLKIRWNEGIFYVVYFRKIDRNFGFEFFVNFY